MSGGLDRDAALALGHRVPFVMRAERQQYLAAFTYTTPSTMTGTPSAHEASLGFRPPKATPVGWQ
jgi:hypothetical protein